MSHEKLRVLDLFSGIGGFSLGLERTGGFETVAFCEIDPFCRKVLKKHWPDVPIFEDVRSIYATGLGTIDIICGGFPCQDISMAGHRAGLEGARSGLWREFFKNISTLRPRYAIVENVSGLLSLGMDSVLGDLASIGFDAEWQSIPACAVGAPHRRDRVWIIAYPESKQAETRLESLPTGRLSRQLGRVLGRARFERLDQPPFLRMDDGVPPELDGHEALGNSVVPQIPEIIGRAILKAEREEMKSFKQPEKETL